MTSATTTTAPFTLYPADAVMTVDQLAASSQWDGPEYTETGVVCGQCTRLARDIFEGFRDQVRHATVDHVRYCYTLAAEVKAIAEADRLNDLAVERFFEEGAGHGRSFHVDQD